MSKLLASAPTPPPIGIHPTNNPSATFGFISILYYLTIVSKSTALKYANTYPK